MSRATVLADWSDAVATNQDMGRKPNPADLHRQCAAELRRLDSLNADLLEACETMLFELAVMQTDALGAVIANARAVIAKAEAQQ